MPIGGDMYKAGSPRPPKPEWWHYGAIVFGIVLFGLIFLTFKDVLGRGGSFFAIIPILLASSFAGLGGGIVVAVFSLFVLLPLLLAVTGYGPLEIITVPSVAAIVLANLFIAISTGAIRGLVDRVRVLENELKRLDRTDFLTNLLNRRAMMETGERELKRAFRVKNDIQYYLGRPQREERRSGGANTHKNRCTIDDYLGVFSCAMVDIDFFKRINDAYGSTVGDEVLRYIAQLLSHEECLRETDIAGRIGGEEFLVLLPGTSSRNALFPMERTRTRLEAHIFTNENGATFNVTVSCGISQLRPNDKSMDDVIRRASKALTHAKDSGRNRVSVYETDLSDSDEAKAAS
ncbi:MAG: diguanylate cyclase [Chitinivibrionales bacterium]|nr:diguanylate cyclase [Chitinivibrionales bacterium]